MRKTTFGLRTLCVIGLLSITGGALADKASVQEQAQRIAQNICSPIPISMCRIDCMAVGSM